MFLNINADNAILSHEFIHLALTSLITFLFWLKFKDKRLILVAFIFGFLIDVDHLFDYFAHFGPVINIRNFLDVESYIHQSGKVYIPFHGWEFVFIFYLIGFFLEKRLKIRGLSLTILFSYLSHLFWDNLSFLHHPLGYSFIFRLVNNFNLKSFMGF